MYKHNNIKPIKEVQLMKWFKRITITIVLMIVTAIGLVYLLLSSSKAQLDG